MAADTIVARLQANARKFPTRGALVSKSGGSWRHLTWQDYCDQVERTGRAFMSLGYREGEVVTILSNNRLEWVLADVAAMAAGGVATGIYQTLTSEDVAYIVAHSESPICVVEDKNQLAKLIERKAEMPGLRWAILLDGDVPEAHRQWVMSWSELASKADATPKADFQARVDGLRSEQLATLIYTSGTTGKPKGVMLSHHNLVWTADSLGKTIPEVDSPRGISYLPLSHIAEQLLSIHCAITMGVEIWFAESLEKLRENLPECRPYIFFGVPRVWEKFEAALTQRLGEATGIKAALVNFARKTATSVNIDRENGQEPSGFLGFKYGIANKLVIGKLKTALGLNECLMFVSGAAPIGKSTLEFFRSLDINIFEVYGQSEGSGPTTLNTLAGHKLGTVGRVIPGVDIKIAEDGEILVHGGNVFQGYYKNEDATRETLLDGWLASGDVGEVDAAGYLRITDRKKELIKTSGGKYVAPQKIEKELKSLPEISQAVVIGDRQKYCTALLTLEEQACRRWAAANGVEFSSLAMLADMPAFKQHIDGHLQRVNAGLAQYETLKQFRLISVDFSVDGGELTPTMKVKRKIVHNKYAALIESMYA